MFLSWLPNLMWVSIFLGILQGTLVFVIWRIFPSQSKKYIWLTCVPLLCSIIMNASSVEFWNQWVMIDLNLLFIIWFLIYLQYPYWPMIPMWVLLICLAPAIYLAGIINSIAIAIIGMLIIITKPPIKWKTDWWKVLITSVFIVIFFIWINWIPFFKSVNVKQLLEISKGVPLSFGNKILQGIQSILHFPIWITLQWANPNSFFIFQSIPAFLNPISNLIIRVICGLQQIQAIVAISIILLSLFFWWFREKNFSKYLKETNKEIGLLVLVTCGFLLLSYALSPIIGGPDWASGERQSQLVGFYMFFIFFWFLSPFIFPLPDLMKKIFSTITIIIALLYSAFNLIGGFIIINSDLNYTNNALGDEDVPLIYKIQAVDFVAQDWKSISDKKIIPIDYQLGGGKWDWIPEFGKEIEKWYPAPFTLGRAFDYELLRTYDLRNAQEGIQLRSFGKSRYLINYSFEPGPYPVGAKFNYYYFGRLRVTVVDW